MLSAWGRIDISDRFKILVHFKEKSLTLRIWFSSTTVSLLATLCLVSLAAILLDVSLVFEGISGGNVWILLTGRLDISGLLSSFLDLLWLFFVLLRLLLFDFDSSCGLACLDLDLGVPLDIGLPLDGLLDWLRERPDELFRCCFDVLFCFLLLESGERAGDLPRFGVCIASVKIKSSMSTEDKLWKIHQIN